MINVVVLIRRCVLVPESLLRVRARRAALIPDLQLTRVCAARLLLYWLCRCRRQRKFEQQLEELVWAGCTAESSSSHPEMQVQIPDDSVFCSFRDQCLSSDGWINSYNKGGVTVWCREEESQSVQKFKVSNRLISGRFKPDLGSVFAMLN